MVGWFWPGNPWTARYRRERDLPQERPAGWLSGSCFLVDLEAFHSVGGFDPAYFMYFEDVDLAERMGRRGWLHIYAPSAVVVHEGGHSTRREPRRMQRVHHTSALRYLSPAIRAVANAPLRWVLRAVSAPACCSPTSAAGSVRGPAAADGGRAATGPAPVAAAVIRPGGRSARCGTR